MSVLLFQERPTAWRRRPSREDGGLDVGEPTPDGYHVYQIKGFTGSMTSSRRGQVRQSLQRILDDLRVDRPVTGWSLVVPLDPTSEDEGWFRQLTAQVPFPARHRDSIWTNCAEHLAGGSNLMLRLTGGVPGG